MKKNLILVAVLVIIVGSIFYIESKKVHPLTSSAPAVDVTLPSFVATSTSAKTFVLDHTGDSLAKEITDPSGFINTPGNLPITISQYIGKKVVLIDFWTYSCINCQRTVPYLQAWYTKYEDQGLVIIGVHTPEFEFEKDYTNVSAAVKRLGITFPVVMDNNYGTWNAYGNHYWPHKYLIDIDGYVTYDQIGEGNYAEDEQAIQKALQDRAKVLGTGQAISGGIVDPTNAITDVEAQSPETYFGSNRNEYLGNGTQSVAGNQTFTYPQTLSTNTLYLSGAWNMQGEFAESTSDVAGIKYNYNAKNVYLVAGASTSVTLSVIQDGVKINTITVSDNKLYTLVQNPTGGAHTLELQVQGKGLQAFTFTFG